MDVNQEDLMNPPNSPTPQPTNNTLTQDDLTNNQTPSTNVIDTQDMPINTHRQPVDANPNQTNDSSNTMQQPMNRNPRITNDQDQMPAIQDPDAHIEDELEKQE